jgi:hypothetical protein
MAIGCLGVMVSRYCLKVFKKRRFHIEDENLLTQLDQIRGLGKAAVLTCTEVMDPFFVVVILSCMLPMSVARVGW